MPTLQLRRLDGYTENQPPQLRSLKKVGNGREYVTGHAARLVCSRTAAWAGF